jgi:hypothetical protein
MNKVKWAVFSVDVETCYPGGEQGVFTYLDIFREVGIKATFFVVGDIAEKYPNIVEKILHDGHEVASHGWHHPTIADPPGIKAPFLTELAETVLEDSLCKSIKTLTDIGAKVNGFRAIQFLINEKVLNVVARNFAYDSSFSDQDDYQQLPGTLIEIPVSTFVYTKVKLGTPVFLGLLFPLPLGHIGMVSSSDPLMIYGHSFDLVACEVPLYTSLFKRMWYYNNCGPERKKDIINMIDGLKKRGVIFVTASEIASAKFA